MPQEVPIRTRFINARLLDIRCGLQNVKAKPKANHPETIQWSPKAIFSPRELHELNFQRRLPGSSPVRPPGLARIISDQQSRRDNPVRLPLLGYGTQFKRSAELGGSLRL